MALSGCAALPKFFDTIFGQQREQAKRTPLYVYRGDLQINVDGAKFDGVGVTTAKSVTIFNIKSEIDIDRVEVETCARQDVCQNAKNCLKIFDVEKGWFGDPSKEMRYTFVPSDIERAGRCPVYFRVFDKSALAAWGFIAMREEEEKLPGTFYCNGKKQQYAGHSVCQSMTELIQKLAFDVPIEEFDVDDNCGMKKINDKTFEFRPKLGLCTGKFYAGGLWHGLDMIAYDQVLVRGK